MTRMTRATAPTFAVAAALALAVPPAAAQDDSVGSYSYSGTASQFGVSTEVEAQDTPEAPDALAALAEDLREDGMPQITWASVSPATDVEIVPLGRFYGDPVEADLSGALAAAEDRIGQIRARIEDDPTLMDALREAGFTPDSVIGAYGASATKVQLVIDDRV